MENIIKDLILGLTTALVAGLCVVFGQLLAEVYGQKFNFLLIASISIVIMTIILVIVLFLYGKKK